MMEDYVQYKFNFQNKEMTMFGRQNIVSDQAIISMVFLNEMFDIRSFEQSKQLHRYYNINNKNNKTPLMIDAGANIGASSRYFFELYPELHILAIEPDENNSQLLKINLEGKKFTLFQGALHCEDANLRLNTSDFDPIAYRVDQKGNKPINAISVNNLLQNTDENIYPYIIKIDIEGWEEHAFSKNIEWIDKFPLLIIELHDWMLPGKSTSKNFLRAISKFNFDFVYKGENIFCFNNKILYEI